MAEAASPDIAIFPQPQQPTRIDGTSDDDVLIGGAGDETIQGFRGDDALVGGDGNDQLDGGIGDDLLDGGAGFDGYDGGPGRDTLGFSSEQGAVQVDLLNSSVVGAGGIFEFVREVENVAGSRFSDTLLGDEYDNVLRGGEGLDVLAGRLGDDVLDGGPDGAIASWAEPQNQFPVIFLAAADAATRAAAGQGGVVVDLALGQALESDGGTDTLRNISGVIGSSGSDRISGDGAANRLTGGDGNDVLAGRGGADVLDGGAGADRLDGGAGRDLADYSGGRAVRVALGAGEAIDSSGALDTLVSIEDVRGSLARDVLTGGGGGNRITGGGSADLLTGGGGADTFVIEERVDVGDHIRDFQTGVDTLELTRPALPGLSDLGAGPISEAAFAERFDVDGERLLYDPGGGASTIALASFAGGAVPDAGDILLV